jgi:hypothetical protein
MRPVALLPQQFLLECDQKLRMLLYPLLISAASIHSSSMVLPLPPPLPSANALCNPPKSRAELRLW